MPGNSRFSAFTATTEGDKTHSSPQQSAATRRQGGSAHQRGDPRTRGPTHRQRRRQQGRHRDRGSDCHGPGGRPRSGRDRAELGAAGRKNSRLRQIQISSAEKSRRGAQEAEGRRDQGDQAAADDRSSRLRREDAVDGALLPGRRQGQGDAAVPRPRNGAPGARLQALRPGQGRHRENRQNRAGTALRGPPGGHGAGAAVRPSVLLGIQGPVRHPGARVAANDTLGPAMRNPDRRRPPPKAIRQTEDPSYWLWLGSRVWYGGSIYHKRHASWLGGA